MSGVDQGINPHTGEPVGAAVAHTPPSDVDQLAVAAKHAAHQLAVMPLPHRAALLRAIAGALEEAREELVALADAETGLGPVRLGGELTRAQAQFELFADAVDEGSFLQVVIDHADPDARPAARPDLRRMLVPIGPVAVFAASNFPFAFSVVGGDTASALAAGCPVIVKAHPGHPGLSVRCGEIIAAVVAHLGAPAGTFALVFGVDAGRDLVRHPAIAAVGFTGSVPGGRALFDLAQSRPDPIPFYGELGSLNPTVVTPGALAERGEAIAAGFVASFTLGSGQFCTKPGLLFLPAGHGLTGTLAARVAATGVGPLLNARIRDGYTRGVAELAAAPGVRPVASGSTASTGSTVDGHGYAVAPTLFAVPAAELTDALLEECFGPTALVVEYGSTAELTAALDAVPGSLTATLHADPATEPDLIRALLAQVSAKAGRVVWDGWPTGVAVTAAEESWILARCELSPLDATTCGRYLSWLLGETSVPEPEGTTGLIWALAHCDDGVTWGRYDAGARAWLLGNQAAPQISPPIRPEALQELRIFGETSEILIWRTGEGLRGRLLRDTDPMADRSERSDPLCPSYEWRILRGNGIVAPCGQGFTHIGDRTGAEQVVPVEASDEQLQTAQVRLKVRHYYESNVETGAARVAATRLVNLTVGGGYVS